MIKYENSRSGIEGYELEENAIVVYFKTGDRYKYSHSTCGQANVTIMFGLAFSDDELNTFINKVQPGFIKL